MKNIIWEITMEEKNNKEKIAEESVQSDENTVAEEANNKELEIKKAGKCRSRKDCRNCRTERSSRVNKRVGNTGRFRAEANCKKERFKE